MSTADRTSFRRFLIIWIGQFISSIGSGLSGFALGIHVYQQTQTATSFSLIIFCAFVPSIVLRPLGGVLADRFDRRSMMMLGDLGSIAGMTLVLAALVSGTTALWPIYLGVTLSSVFVALQSPAYKASITDLLPEAQFAKASGMVQLASSAQYLFAPIIAGYLLAVTDIRTVLLIDILSFALAIFAVLAVRQSVRNAATATTGSPRFLAELVEGWQAIADNRGVLLLVAVISLLTFYIGFLQTLLGPMILAFTDAKTYGTTLSVAAVGMLVSSLFISTAQKSNRHANLLTMGLAGTGLFFALTGVSTNINVITAMGFLFFCALPFVNTSADVLIRRNIDNEKQGRVWGIIGVVSQIGFIVSYASAGFLADHVFNPLLVDGGALAGSVGRLIGTGPGRGIALLFLVSGSLVVVLAALTTRMKSIRAL